MTTVFRATDAQSAQAFRIGPTDTNYFAILFDKHQDDIEHIFVIEIFKVGGATPPNEHAHAHEFFYVLAGEGVALCGDKEVPLSQGKALLLNPGNEHVVRNTGSSKLYTLTVMTPNEGFAELIRSGERVELDEEDLRVLSGVKGSSAR
ncbi:cupin domain-containing protein [Rouxiella sp. S1S-2]|uniref:cupin domain-containing protein n=1 Tax=Rouxiella sp. S1S-2 TaxID=2653856 RepID=UPI0012644B96|nr:cupin domain-containing protein [Rouxiella sp. S1S-2]KAB7894979.1 cupin domain-containing protein [Rouxiella sp. S1S-2]